jgi:hypothetical protein
MVDENLRKYVTENLGKFTPDQIKTHLLQNGWAPEQIDEALKGAQNAGTVPKAKTPIKGNDTKPVNLGKDGGKSLLSSPLLIVIIAVVGIGVIGAMFMLGIIKFGLTPIAPGDIINNGSVPGGNGDTTPPPVVLGPIDIGINPSTVTLSQGDTVSIEVKATDSEGLFGFQFDLEYDSAILEYVSIEEGLLLNNGGADDTFCVAADVSTQGLIDNYACTRLNSGGSVTGVEGTGVLATVTFRSLSSGTSRMDLTNVKLADTRAQEIEAITSNGIVTVS